MNQTQRIAVIGVLLAAVNELGVKTDLTPLEASKLQVKLLEFIEQHGGAQQAEKLMETEVCNVIRTLYEEIMNDTPSNDCVKHEAQMMKDAQNNHDERCKCFKCTFGVIGGHK